MTDVALPHTLLVLMCGVLGLLVGSFLNVVVWRVPRGGSVVAPPSSCPECGTRIRARDNVPVMSWLLLRGRCRSCGAPISRRYPLVEAGTAVAFVGVAFLIGPQWTLPAMLYLAAISIALALIDLDVRRLPNAIVLPSYVVGAVLLGVPALLDGEPGVLVRMALGGGALWLFYFALVLVRPGGMGFGDVKLAGVLGMYLAAIGWGALLVGAFAAFLLGGVYAVGLLLTGRAGRKTGVPFGPWMLLGAWIGIAVGEVAWSWYVGLLG